MFTASYAMLETRSKIKMENVFLGIVPDELIARFLGSKEYDIAAARKCRRMPPPPPIDWEALPYDKLTDRAIAVLIGVPEPAVSFVRKLRQTTKTILIHNGKQHVIAARKMATLEALVNSPKALTIPELLNTIQAKTSKQSTTKDLKEMAQDHMVACRQVNQKTREHTATLLGILTFTQRRPCESVWKLDATHKRPTYGEFVTIDNTYSAIYYVNSTLENPNTNPCSLWKPVFPECKYEILQFLRDWAS